ncbi:hypothetical protein DLAC_06110 [Tieghemostelium lacteum]|uniref:EGF-like domain-containing protein n=1 Tax=Tieghemostelium lacteum TaxID=361077 RepID=A0A151ZHG3_TIELA|nr:hypothetical protein DLAC_06110 [Tieghemostelium lacteum]|eukprot:KYQ93421.1 hypothetical protein DLAC_06110 [Tieghemostelium lacteum]
MKFYVFLLFVVIFVVIGKSEGFQFGNITSRPLQSGLNSIGNILRSDASQDYQSYLDSTNQFNILVQTQTNVYSIVLASVVGGTDGTPISLTGTLFAGIPDLTNYNILSVSCGYRAQTNIFMTESEFALVQDIGLSSQVRLYEFYSSPGNHVKWVTNPNRLIVLTKQSAISEVEIYTLASSAPNTGFTVSNNPTKTLSLNELDSVVNFMYYDGASFIYAFKDSIFYQYNVGPSATNGFELSGSSSAIVGGSTLSRGAAVATASLLYVCSQVSGMVNIEQFDPNTLSAAQMDPISGGLYTISSCLSAQYDQFKGIVFFLIQATDGTLGFISFPTSTTTFSGLTVNWIPLLNAPMSANKQSYSLGLLNPDPSIQARLSIVLPNATLIHFPYTSYCPNDCSGHGICFETTCTCDADYVLDDCSILEPTITGITRVSYSSPSNVTILGTGFINATTIEISISGIVECTNAVYISSTEIHCTTNDFTDSSLSPFQNQTLTLKLDSYESDPVDIGLIFTSPKVTSIDQNEGIVTVRGSDFYTLTFMEIKLGSQSWENIHTLSDGSGYACVLPNNADKQNLTVLAVGQPQIDPYYNQDFIPEPYLTSLSQNVIPTASTVITINGKFFNVYTGEQWYVVQGNIKTLVTPIATNTTALIYTTVNGLIPNTHISVTLKPSGMTSNLLSFTYESATVTSISQMSPETNLINIRGTNLGNSDFSVNVKDPKGSELKLIEVSNTQIDCELKNDTIKGTFTIDVIGSDTIEIPLNLKPNIDSISYPSIHGGSNITIQGEFLWNTTVAMNTGSFDDYITCNSEGLTNYPVSTLICPNIVSGTGTINYRVVSQLSGQMNLESSYDTTYHPPILSSINPTSYRQGQTVKFTITGSEFNDAVNSVSINNEDCEIIHNIEGEVICTLVPVTDPSTVTNPVSVSLDLSGVKGYNNNTLIYQKSCPDQCSNKGTCDNITGKCTCMAEYTGDNCSQLKQDSSEDEISYSTLTTVNFTLVILILIVILLCQP